MTHFIKYKTKQPQANQDIPSGSRGDFFTKGKTMKYKNNIIRLLSVIAALLLTKATNAEEKTEIKPGLSVTATTEQDGAKKNHAEVLLKPKLEWEKDGYKAGYYGSFYKSKDTDGAEQEWTTLVSKVRVESDDWDVEIGRSNTREHTCGTTIDFDNRAAGKGSTRTHTGAIGTYQGWSLGLVSSEARMTSQHWNCLLVGWKGNLTDSLAIQLQAKTGKRELLSSATTIKWQPTSKTSVMGDIFYQNHETTGSLTANHNLSDDLTLFAGAQITSPHKGTANGLANLGLKYTFWKDFKAWGAVQQQIGQATKTAALLGLQWSYDF